jgi:hypothetical protein
MREGREAGTTVAEAKTKLTPQQQSAVLYWPTVAKIPIIPCDSRSKALITRAGTILISVQ